MSRSRYFDVDRADGKPANIIDYVGAFIMAVLMVIFVIVPYLIVSLLAMAIAVAYVNIRYWITGAAPMTKRAERAVISFLILIAILCMAGAFLPGCATYQPPCSDCWRAL